MNDKLKATFKSQDTEEWLDIYWTRPIGLMWANFFNRFGVHPNTITVISIFLGMAAGILMYWNNPLHALLAILLLMWANFYDSADGQLARMTGKKTHIGRILDGAAGDIWFFFIYAALCLRMTSLFGIWIWILASISGFHFHVHQAQLADYYRNVHLFFLKGEQGSEMDSYRKACEEYNKLSWKKDFIFKFFQWFYKDYTHNQEKMTPRFQILLGALREKYPQGAFPEQLRNDFRCGSLPLMKWTNILQFNTRTITLYILLLISAFSGYECTWLYFVFEITVLNIIWLRMRRKHEQLSTKIYNHLNEY